jgi:small subunit ribosomal protein S16
MPAEEEGISFGGGYGGRDGKVAGGFRPQKMAMLRKSRGLTKFLKFFLASRDSSSIFRPRPHLGSPKRRIIMAVAIRLNRKGTKDRPYYKIVAVDSRKRRDGRYIEQLGTYDPLIDGTNYVIDLEKADKWLTVGAKASETVASIIRKARTAATKS